MAAARSLRHARTTTRIAIAVVVSGLVLSIVSASRPAVERGAAVPAPAPVTEAADVATAAHAARQQGSRVEVVSERAPDRTVHALPTGGLEAELSAVPRRVERDGRWVDIDPTLTRTASGTVAPKAALGSVELSGGGTGAPLVSMTDEGRSIALTWPDALPEPELDGARATYREVLPGVDLVMIADRSGYQQHLVVATAEAARHPRLAEIRLGAHTAGLTLSADPDGTLWARDAAGEPVFTAPPSVMWDASGPAGPDGTTDAGSSASARVGVEVATGELVLRPDLAFLADPATVYPVTIDPAMHTFHKTAWATIVEGRPTSDWLNTSPGGSTNVQSGRCWNGNNDCGVVDVARTYFQYDTSFLAGRTVTGVSFDSAVKNSPACTSYTHDVRWVGAWPLSTNTTWATRNDGVLAGSGAANGVHTLCTGWKPFSAALDPWEVNPGGISTYLLRAADEGPQAAWRRFDPPSTILRVTYNQAPGAPYDLATDPALPATPCHHCQGQHWVGTSTLTLMARMSDPDGDTVRPTWHIRRNLGAVQPTFGNFQASGALHQLPVDVSAASGVTHLEWSVESYDGTAGGNWTPFPAVNIDRSSPNGPTIAARVYQADNRWHGGLDVPDRFTFTANSPDVNHFEYRWTGGSVSTVVAETLGGSATVTLTPPDDGPMTLFVRAVDRAGNRSLEMRHVTHVRAGNSPLAQWSFEGTPNDDAYLGDRHGTLHGPTSYSPGAVGSAARFEHGGHVSAPNTVRTDASFTVAAWARLDSAVDAHAVISQLGVSNNGFALWRRLDGGVPKWAFGKPRTDAAAAQVDIAWSAAPAQLGKWTHLAGVFDASAGQLRLYVDGVLAGTAAHTATWHAGGDVRIGNQRLGGADVDHWRGPVDEAQMYDRALADTQVRALVDRSDVRVAHWRFDDDGDGSTVRNTVDGGDMLVLENGAAIGEHGAVGTGLALDGVDDHATTNMPAVRTDQSYSVAAWVKADELRDTGSAMTVVSQDGTHFSGLLLHYNSVVEKWGFSSYDQDTPSAMWVGVTASQPAVAGQWTHLAGVYDRPSGEFRIYVNGELGGVAAWAGSVIAAAGPLVVGRGKRSGQHAEHWPGAIDEVRVYSRAISPDEVRGIVERDGVTAGTWTLDGGTTDSSGNGRHATVTGDPLWTAGQSTFASADDLAVQLDGLGSHLSAPDPLDTSASFSASAWVRLDRTGPTQAFVAQDGAHTYAFSLQVTSGGRWAFGVAGTDQHSPPLRMAESAEPAQIGVWTHLAGVLSATSNRMELYVNGVLSGTATRVGGFDATGSLQIGRAKWVGGPVDHADAAIDDVTVHQRALFADEVRTMAGRDLSLVHHWPLDEQGGPNAGDVVGQRPGTLAGAARVDSRVGRGVDLDGVDDVVGTAGVDVRADRSFTVGAWVNLRDNDCDYWTTLRCRYDAVTLDGALASKFRLGHVIDTFSYPLGNWIFEMPESDAMGAEVTQAAVSVDSGEVGTWVHLMGVYDAPTGKLWLYVNGDRVGDGVLQTPWTTTGGLQIGRGKADGAADGWWGGGVDDVRLYTGALDQQRIAALHAAYPAPAPPATVPVANAGRWAFDEGAGTTAADTSGANRTVTLHNGAGWVGGRAGQSSWYDGATEFGQTAGPVVDTNASFSYTAWAYLEQKGGVSRGVLTQDGAQTGAFLLQYNAVFDRWAVVVPHTDAASPAVTILTSPSAPTVYEWTHLAVTYDAASQVLRLYVNGVLAAAEIGVDTWQSNGPLGIGRGRWGGGPSDALHGGVDDVRAFTRALTDGEVRAVHGDVAASGRSMWRFDGNGSDALWRGYSMVLERGTSYTTAGVQGKALQMSGTSDFADTAQPAVGMRDSFSVSAWARPTAGGGVRTVVAQDGQRMSGFAIALRPESGGRWTFGGAAADGDGSSPVVASSAHPAQLNRWTHLVGVYDHAARELRLYVDGVLSGTRGNAALWPATGDTSVGRGLHNGQRAHFFAGAIDEVRVEQGVLTPAQIAERGGWAAPSGEQLARVVDRVTGDTRTVSLGGSAYAASTDVPAGHRFGGSLGRPLAATQQPGTQQLTACRAGDDTYTVVGASCGADTVVGPLGWIHATAPAGKPSRPLYRCLVGTDRVDSLDAACEGGTQQAVLGHVVAYVPLTLYSEPSFGKHAGSPYAMPPGWRFEGAGGFVQQVAGAGMHPITSCLDGVDPFLSTSTTCEGKTVQAYVGHAWATAPPGLASAPLYRCSIPGHAIRFLARDPACHGHTVEQFLGHVLDTVPA